MRHSRFQHIIKKAYQSVRDRQTETTFFLVLAFVTGLLTGVAAFLLKRMIGCVSQLLTSCFNADGPNYLLLLIPIVGIVLTGIFVRYILRYNVEHGVARLLDRIRNKRPVMKRRLTFGSMIASTFTLGFGGSAGSEGPIAFTGAAIGSNVARAMKMSPSMMMVMLGCGAGAGIAGIFKAPVGGALFTIEVLRMELTTTSVFALFIASITSALTAFVLSGCTFDVPWATIVPFDMSLIPWVIALGIFCGLYSYYYAWVMKKLSALFSSIKNQWIRNISSGAVLAVLVFLFPALYGEGYGVIGEIVNGNTSSLMRDSLWAGSPTAETTLLVVAAGILLVKCIATSASNSGGGVAGDFAPTLFAGAIAGLLFASAVNLTGLATIDASHFALIGMGAVMAGAIRAPMMAIFLTIEMTASYSFIVPIVLSATISFAIVKALTPGSFYNLRRLHLSSEKPQ